MGRKNNMDLFNRKKVKSLKEILDRRDERIKELEGIIEAKEDKLDNLRQKVSDIQKSNLKKIEQLKKDAKKEREIYSRITQENTDLKKANKILNDKVEDLVREKVQAESDIERLNKKVDFLSTNRRAPSKEEIEAYDKGYKELERRQLEEDKKRREGTLND